MLTKSLNAFYSKLIKHSGYEIERKDEIYR